MTKNIIAVIPIRESSQRIKNKNLRPFNKKNLLIHKIEKLKKIKYIDEIIVNTDSEQAIKIAKDCLIVKCRRSRSLCCQADLQRKM